MAPTPPPPHLLPRSSSFCSSVVTPASPRKGNHRPNTTIPNVFTTSTAAAQLSLLRAHARAGRMRPAREVFDEMPARSRSLIAWTTIMSGYATHGPAPRPPRRSSCSSACSACSSCPMPSSSPSRCVPAPPSGASVSAGSSTEPSPSWATWTRTSSWPTASSPCTRAAAHWAALRRCSVDNCLIGFYGRSGELQLMRKVFIEMDVKDLVSWNTIIQCYAENLRDEEALAHFRAMMFECEECDEFTLHVVTRRGVFDHGLDSYKHVMSTLMDMYVNWASLHKRHQMFPLRMLKYYLSVQGELDQFIVASSLKSCASDIDLAAGRMLHACILKRDMNPDSFVTSSLVDMYAKCGALEESNLLFSRSKNPGTAAWSAVISGNCLNGQYGRAMHLFRRMQEEHVQPNEFTYTAVLTACMALGDAVSGMEIHSNSIRNGYGTNTSVLKSLVNFYLRQGQHHQALKLCLSLSNHEVSWGTFVEVFSQVNDHVGIVDLFHVIQRRGVELDHQTARLVMSSCGKLALLEEGLQAHAHMTKRGLASTACMNSHLIDMYSSCGTLRHAFDAFNYMPDKDASSWTSIIAANVENGCPETAIRLFSQMLRKEECRPTSQAFLLALKACAEIGLVSEAFRFFVSMTEVYRIEPSEGHYSHMIEILGRAGCWDVQGSRAFH